MAEQGVEVGPVDIHLAAMTVNDVADLGDGFFEHPVRGGVGDQRGGENGGAEEGHAAHSTFRPS